MRVFGSLKILNGPEVVKGTKTLKTTCLGRLHPEVVKGVPKWSSESFWQSENPEWSRSGERSEDHENHPSPLEDAASLSRWFSGSSELSPLQDHSGFSDLNGPEVVKGPKTLRTTCLGRVHPEVVKGVLKW